MAITVLSSIQCDSQCIGWLPDQQAAGCFRYGRVYFSQSASSGPPSIDNAHCIELMKSYIVHVIIETMENYIFCMFYIYYRYINILILSYIEHMDIYT